MKISLIIAIQNDRKIFIDLLESVNTQERLPDELIVIDSSTNNNYYNQLEEELNKIKIDNKYLKIKKSFQGKGLNEGIKIATGEIICFLDTKTIPVKHWIKDYEKLIVSNNLDIIWGSTKFTDQSYFQSLYKAATYGNICHQTVPGSMLYKNICKKYNFYFDENLRSSFDLEWKEIIQSRFKSFFPKKSYLSYNKLPKNFINLFKRHAIYAYYTAIGNSQNNLKDFYLAIFLVFTALTVPRWNYLFEDWDRNILYIPNITKIYLLCIILIGLIYFVLKKIKILKNFFFFEFSIKTAIFIFVSLGIYRWNFSIAKWVEESVFYIPHITKIYIFSIIGLTIIYRGILRPIKREIYLNYLIPTNWLLVGLIGLCIDLIKMPFFVIGSIYSNLKTLNKIIRKIWLRG